MKTILSDNSDTIDLCYKPCSKIAENKKTAEPIDAGKAVSFGFVKLFVQLASLLRGKPFPDSSYNYRPGGNSP